MKKHFTYYEVLFHSGCAESNRVYCALFFSVLFSGWRESNSHYKTPSLAYYHYTTPRE